jgi:hypothetical protein
METRIREILINWAKFKDQVPIDNSDIYGLYTQKLRSLLTGQESLGKSTFQEWSKDVENRFETIDDYRDYSFTQGECLAGLIVDIVEDHLCIESWDDERVTNQQWAAFKAMWHAIESLTTFSSKDLLEILEGSSINDNKPSHQQIRESVDIIEKHYLLAMKGSIEGDISPLLNLCDATFTALLHAKQVSTVMPKAKQQSNAGKIKNKPYRDTEKYAISLYQEKERKTKQNGVDQIQYKVMEYGRKAGVNWTTDRQANKTIYKWIRDRINKNK